MAGRHQLQNVRMTGEIVDIFNTVQRNITHHEKYLKNLMKLYEKNEKTDFFDNFIKCLEVPLQIGEKNMKVERTLDFASKFCCLLNESTDETTTHPFTTSIFKFLLKYNTSVSASFRYRVCQFINKILNFLGENAELEDFLCDEILVLMLDRLQDTKHQVRTQAVIALHRLQNPSDPQDMVTKSYLFHMAADPSSQVRRAVVNNLARSPVAVTAVMQRTRDVDFRVRRDAYMFLSLFTFKAFKIHQRIYLIKNGIKDRSASVRKCVTETLVQKWLTNFDNSYFDLLKGLKLDATVSVLKESIEVSELLLKVLFTTSPTNKIIDMLPLDENKLLEINSLNHETVVYWRCLANYFHTQSGAMDDQLDEILPELTNFCNYIRSFCTTVKPNMDKWEKLVYQSILNQLFEMTKYFDLADEVGRCNLKSLIVDKLLHDSLFDYVIVTMVDIFATIVPNVEVRFQELIQIISDIGEPFQSSEPVLTEDEVRRKQLQICELRFKLAELTEEEREAVDIKDYTKAITLKEQVTEIRSQINALNVKPQAEPQREKTDDHGNLMKALDIIIAMLSIEEFNKLTPELRSLQQHFISDCSVMRTVPKIEARSMRCLTLCALLDVSLAQSIMPVLYVRVVAHSCFRPGSALVLLACLGGVIDLLLRYGLENFPDAENSDSGSYNKTKRTLYNNTQEDEEIEVETERVTNLPISTSSNEIMSCIVSFLDNEDVDIRTLVADGLCRMFALGRLKSPSILSRLIILWFNPATAQDTKLRQIVGILLSFYAKTTPGSQEIFERAFLPTLRTFSIAPHSSPLSEVDTEIVVRFIITHTHPGFHNVDTVNIHNNLAIAICEEIIANPNTSCSLTLIKCLPLLEISDDDTVLRNDLYNLCLKVQSVVTYRFAITYLKKFITKLGIENNTNETEDNLSNTPSLDRMSNETSLLNRSNEQLRTNNVRHDNNSQDKQLRVLVTPIPKEKFQQLLLSRKSLSASRLSQEINRIDESIEISESNNSLSITTTNNLVISTSESESTDLSEDSSSESDSEFVFQKPNARPKINARRTMNF